MLTRNRYTVCCKVSFTVLSFILTIVTKFSDYVVTAPLKHKAGAYIKPKLSPNICRFSAQTRPEKLDLTDNSEQE